MALSIRGGYWTHQDCAAPDIVFTRGLENLVIQGLWGMEIAYKVSLWALSELI
ncbi:MAG: hypothetical protein F6K17_04000 [Okeania sp. SIO3C4]|nr:hypothetical protein [Okeania sp. SIO3C4]